MARRLKLTPGLACSIERDKLGHLHGEASRLRLQSQWCTRLRLNRPSLDACNSEHLSIAGAKDALGTKEGPVFCEN